MVIRYGTEKNGPPHIRRVRDRGLKPKRSCKRSPNRFTVKGYIGYIISKRKLCRQ